MVEIQGAKVVSGWRTEQREKKRALRMALIFSSPAGNDC
jgi:hypothetical protein